jgi:hypothetical protein
MEASMSWLEATKIDESAEDIALRDELQNILGLAQIERVQASPTQESTALAQSLYREAMRRRRGGASAKPFSKEPLFMLAAATMPLLLTAAALGAWGIKQKHRADAANAALAAMTLEMESRQNRLDTSREGTRNRENSTLLHASEAGAAEVAAPVADRPENSNKGELVKPEERPARLNSRPAQQRVNDPR